MESSFILIKRNVRSGDFDWNILGVYSSAISAQVAGWLALIKIAFLPYKREFFFNRNGEFSDLCCLPDFYVEEWSGTIRKKTWRLGWDIKVNHHKNYIDEYLKSLVISGQSYDDTLDEFRSILQEFDQVPPILDNMTCVIYHAH